jgi:hypothetical protein
MKPNSLSTNVAASIARAASKRLVCAALGLLSFAVGCVPTFNDETSLIAEARLLAIAADPAEPRPDQAITLTALWVDEKGEPVADAPVSWAFCKARKALTEIGPIAPECVTEFGSETEALLPLGEGPSVSTTLPSDTCRLFGPLSPPLEPGQTVPGRSADPDSSGGYFQPLVAGETKPVVTSVRAYCGAAGLSLSESILFNQGYRPNEHPRPSEILRRQGDDEDPVEGVIQLEPGEELELVVEFPECPSEPKCGDGICSVYENATSCGEDCRTNPVGCSGSEGYLYPDPEQRAAVLRQERLEIGWFSSEGSFELATTDDANSPGVVQNVWTAPDDEMKTRLWLVARDDRGGISWQSVEVDVSSD